MPTNIDGVKIKWPCYIGSPFNRASGRIEPNQALEWEAIKAIDLQIWISPLPWSDPTICEVRNEGGDLKATGTWSGYSDIDEDTPRAKAHFLCDLDGISPGNFIITCKSTVRGVSITGTVALEIISGS